MVEAAFILPLLILMIASLLLLSVFCYEHHCGQIACHRELLESFDNNKTAYALEKESVSTKKTMRGLTEAIIKREQQHRIYKLRPAQWICLGEVVNIDEE